MNTVKFSVLSYYPSMVTDENINVGIIFQIVESNTRTFYTLKNWKRLKAFDDNLDTDFMKAYLTGMVSDFTGLFSAQISLEDYTRTFVNELRFHEISENKTDDAEKFIDQTKKVFMKFDYEKKERLSVENEIRYIKKQLKDNRISFASSPVSGSEDEPVKFDFCVGDYCFKTFSCENKNLKKSIMTYKGWAYTAQNLPNKKAVFIFDNAANQEVQMIKRMLSKTAKVLGNQEVLDFIKGNKQSQPSRKSISKPQ